MPPSLPAACSGFGRPRTTTDVFADGPLWTMAPARFAARTASIRLRLRMPVNARCTPFSERSAPALSAAGGLRERVDQLVGALVPFPTLADAAIDDLLQVVAAGEPANLGGPHPHARVAFDQHPEQLPHLIHVVARLPAAGRRARRCSLGAVSEFIVRAVMPRRSLCWRTMPKSPSLRRRPSQTNTFSGVRSRCSAGRGGACRSTSSMPAISRRAAASVQPRVSARQERAQVAVPAYSSARQ